MSRAIFQTCLAALSNACLDLHPNRSTPFRKKWGHFRHCRQDTSCKRVLLILSTSASSLHSTSMGCFSHSYNSSMTKCTYSRGFPGKSRCLSYKVFNMLRQSLLPAVANSMSSASLKFNNQASPSELAPLTLGNGSRASKENPRSFMLATIGCEGHIVSRLGQQHPFCGQIEPQRKAGISSTVWRSKTVSFVEKWLSTFTRIWFWSSPRRMASATKEVNLERTFLAERYPEAVINSVQRDMERFRSSLSFNIAQPGGQPSSMKLNTPIWLRYKWISKLRGERTLTPSYLPSISFSEDINRGSSASTCFKSSWATVQMVATVL